MEDIKKIESSLEKASRGNFTERRKIIDKYPDEIKKILDSKDPIPPRHFKVKKIEAQVNRVGKISKDGEKQERILLTNSYKVTFKIIQTAIKEIIDYLEQEKIEAEELQRGWRTDDNNKCWSKKEIEELPFDWIRSAVIKYYDDFNDTEKKDDPGRLTAEELEECLDLIKARKN